MQETFYDPVVTPWQAPRLDAVKNGVQKETRQSNRQRAQRLSYPLLWKVNVIRSRLRWWLMGTSKIPAYTPISPRLIKCDKCLMKLIVEVLLGLRKYVQKDGVLYCRLLKAWING